MLALLYEKGDESLLNFGINYHSDKKKYTIVYCHVSVVEGKDLTEMVELLYLG